MASNESFLHNLSSGFNGFVKFFTPSFLMRGSPPLLTTDDKSAPLDQNRSFENNVECRHICNKAVSKKLQNLPLDIDCSETEYESERLFNGTFDPPLDSLGKNDNSVVRPKSYQNNDQSLSKSESEFITCTCPRHRNCRSVADHSSQKHDPYPFPDTQVHVESGLFSRSQQSPLHCFDRNEELSCDSRQRVSNRRMNTPDIVETFTHNPKYLGRNINPPLDSKHVAPSTLTNHVTQRGPNGANADFDMHAFYNDLEGTNFGEKATNVQKSTKLINRKPKEPDTFDGNKVEWNDYVCHFEQVAQWNEWNDHEKALQLAMSLRGVAQRVLGELPREILCQYETLKSVLMQRFCPPERVTAYRCEFRNRRRNREESVVEYGYALKRLASRAFPSIPIEMRESLIVEQYISGLGNQDIKRHIQFAHPSTLDRAISLAVEFEAFEGSYNVLRKPNEPVHSNVMALTNTGNSEKDIQKTPCHSNLETSRLDRLEDSMRDVKESLKNLSNKPERPRQVEKTEQRNHTRSQIKTRDSQKFICFNCNEEGHISRNCPKKNSNYARKESVRTPRTQQSKEHANLN